MTYNDNAFARKVARPSATAKHAPIGTKYSAVASLCEQRGQDTYHQLMPMPGANMERLQSALLARPRRINWPLLTVAAVSVCSAASLVVFAR